MEAASINPLRAAPYFGGEGRGHPSQTAGGTSEFTDWRFCIRQI